MFNLLKETHTCKLENEVTKKADRHHELKNLRVHLRRDNWVWVSSSSTTGVRLSQGSGKNHYFNSISNSCVKTTLMHNKVLHKTIHSWDMAYNPHSKQWLIKEKAQTVELKASNCEPSMAAVNPNIAETKTFVEAMKFRVERKDFKSRFTWWGELHMHLNISASQWVLLYSHHCIQLNPIIDNQLLYACNDILL